MSAAMSAARCPPRAAGPRSSGATRTTAAGLRAPSRVRAPVEQDDAEAGGQGVRQARSAAAGKSHGERRGPAGRVQQCHLSHAPLVPALSAGLTSAAGGHAGGTLARARGPVLRAVTVPGESHGSSDPVTAARSILNQRSGLGVLAGDGPRGTPASAPGVPASSRPISARRLPVSKEREPTARSSVSREDVRPQPPRTPTGGE